MAKMKTGWKGERTRHSNARKYGRAGGKYHKLTGAQKRTIGARIRSEHDEMALTHPREVRGMHGLYYLKAGKVHRVSHKRDTGIKAQHRRKPASDSWRGDLKGSRY